MITAAIFNTVAFIVLFINLSSIYGYIGYQLGLESSRDFSILLGLLATPYLLFNFRTALSIAKVPVFLGWISFIIILPTAISSVQFLQGTLSLDALIYSIAFNANFGLLFMTASTFAVRVSRGWILCLYLLSLCGATFGFIYNYLDYGLVRNVLEFISSAAAPSITTSRLIGFFPWPNEAAIALVMYAFALSVCVSVQHRAPTTTIIGVAAFACVILLTGSRTSLFLLGVLLIFLLKKDMDYLKREGQLHFWIMSFSLGVGIFVVAASALGTVMSDSSAFQEMTDRLGNLFLSFGGAAENDDASLDARTTILRYYYDIILHQPIFGVGMETLSNMLQFQALANVSQNSWIEWAARYGIPYSAFGAMLFAWTYVVAVKGSNGDQYEQCKNVKLLLIILSIASLSLVDIFWIRSVAVTTAIMIGDMIATSARISGSESNKVA
jgi:O-antigen ligase